jgi:hypothetical protein
MVYEKYVASGRREIPAETLFSFRTYAKTEETAANAQRLTKKTAVAHQRREDAKDSGKKCEGRKMGNHEQSTQNQSP